MTAPLSAIDHIIVGASNLGRAQRMWKAFGFTLTPRGQHDGGATANHCVMFADSYLELLAPTGIGTSALASAVAARGDGGLGLAFASADSGTTASALRAAGINAHDPVLLSRPLTLDGETQRVEFENVSFEAGLPALFTFACHHVTPHLTRARHEWQLHANTATGISEIVIFADDPQVYRRALETLVGFDRTADGPHGVNAVLDNLGLAVMNRIGIAERFGTQALAGLTEAPVIAAVSFRVNETDATSAMLDVGGIDFIDHHTGLVVPATKAGGIIVEFAED